MKPPLSLLPLYYPATIKEVSRFNILFDGEDEAALEALVGATVRHKVRVGWGWGGTCW